MAKKDNKISVNALERTIEENIVTVPLLGTEGVDITIRRRLPLKDMLQFVEDVVSSCVDAAEGSYRPEIKDFAVGIAVLSYYANFRLPSNVEKQYELIYNTPALGQVKEQIDYEQFTEILCAIDGRIEHGRRMIESTAQAKTGELISRFEELAEKMGRLFGDISAEDIGGALKAMAASESLDEEKLVKAVFDAQNEQAGTEQTETKGGEIISFQRDK